MIPIIAVFSVYLTALTITQNKYYIIPNVLATLHASNEFMTFNFERISRRYRPIESVQFPYLLY